MGGMACLTWRASTLLGSMSLVLVVLVCASMHHYRSLIDFKGGDGVALLQAAGRNRHVREHVLCIHSDADCRPTPLHEDNAVEIEAQKDQKRIRMQEAAVKNRIKALRVQLLRAKRLEHSKQEHVIAALKKATASVLDDTWRLPAKPASPPPTDVGATAPKPAPREEAGAHALRKSLEAYWLQHPGADVQAFLGATRRWDASFTQAHRRKLTEEHQMQLQMQHDTLPEDDTEFVPDGDILTRVQYLVATHDFLTTHGDATLADWHARQAVLLQQLPQDIQDARWADLGDSESELSSHILRAVEGRAGGGEAFRVHDHLMERSRKLYLQAMHEFFVGIEGVGEGSRAEEEWREAQRLWEALQDKKVQAEAIMWRKTQSQKLVSDEERLQALTQQQQEQQHASVRNVPQDATHELRGPRGMHTAAGQRSTAGRTAAKVTREGMLTAFKRELKQTHARNGAELVAHATWIQSLAVFAQAVKTLPADSKATAALHTDTLGAVSPVVRAWASKRRVWELLWEGERAMDAEQREIELARAAALACHGDAVHAVAAKSENVHGNREEGVAMASRAPRGDRATLQSLYMVTDASADASMLRHYWQSFTARPPSHLPAFGMAQTGADLKRHAGAARRAVLRDCGSHADCRWMHALEAEGTIASRTGGVQDPLSSRRGRVVGRKESARRISSEDKERATVEEKAVQGVLAEEVKMNQQETGNIFPKNAALAKAESALVSEAKALLAQKRLVQEHVQALLRDDAHDPHAAAVFHDLQAALGPPATPASRAPSRKSSQPKPRSDKKKSHASPRDVTGAAAPTHAGTGEAMLDASKVSADGAKLRQLAKVPMNRDKMRERAQATTAGQTWTAAQGHQGHHRSSLAASPNGAPTPDEGDTSGADSEAVGPQSLQEEGDAWEYVGEFVPPWDPCSPRAVVTAREAVREYDSMCADVSYVRAATRPRDALSLLSVVEFRPVDAASGVGDHGWGGHGRHDGACGGQREMLRINDRQAALNRKRFKLYVDVFGAVFPGEGEQAVSTVSPGKLSAPGVQASDREQSMTQSILSMMGLGVPPAQAKSSAFGDSALQALLRQIHRHKPDWARIAKVLAKQSALDWDAIGRASPALLRLSPQGRTILSEVKRRGSSNTTPFHGREGMAGAGAGAAGSTAAALADAERSRRAMGQALKAEEAQLLRAEERVLLQRRKVLSRALGSRTAPDFKQKNVFNS